MKNLIILLIINLSINLLTGCLASTEWKTVLTGGSYQGMIFFSCGKTLIGINSNTLKEETRLVFSNRVYCGGQTADGTVYLSILTDNPSQSILLALKDGKPVWKKQAAFTADFIRLLGNTLLVSSLRSYQALLLVDPAGGQTLMSNGDSLTTYIQDDDDSPKTINGDYFFYMPSFKCQETNIPGCFLQVSTRKLSAVRIPVQSGRDYDYIDYTAEEDRLYILDGYGHMIYLTDAVSGSVKRQVSLKKTVRIPENLLNHPEIQSGPSTYLFLDQAVIIENRLYCFYRYYSKDVVYQRLLAFDKYTLEYISEMNLDEAGLHHFYRIRQKFGGNILLTSDNEWMIIDPLKGLIIRKGKV